MRNSDIENYLRPKYEGKLFVEYWFMPSIDCSEFHFEESFYTVQGGEVYLIEKNGELAKTGDNLFDLRQCLMVGSFDKNNKPLSRTIKNYKLADILKRLEYTPNCDVAKLGRLLSE